MLRLFTMGMALTCWSALMFLATSSGCSDREHDCHENMEACDPGTTPPTPLAQCKGIDEEDPSAIPDGCAIFTRLEGDDANKGTKDRPVKTLGKAIELAAGGPMLVYACAGKQPFNEVVTLPSGMTLRGGVDCENGWKLSGEMTTLTAASDSIPLRLASGKQPTRIRGVHVAARSASKAGNSSIAVTIEEVEADIKDAFFESGAGAAGAKGASGSDGSTLPKPGDGMNGSDADVDQNSVKGGIAGTSYCGEKQSGGDGGAGGIPTFNDEIYMGDIGPSNGGQGYGEGDGGKGGNPITEIKACNGPTYVGHPGAIGAPGGDGAGGGQSESGALGSLDPQHGYVGLNGKDGSVGGPGQGGGGGGGRAVIVDESQIPKKYFAGSSGGGGGGGGCGGKGGHGGAAGGSSIALVLLGQTHVNLDNVTLNAGIGGNGGDGGDGQEGAKGGLGGLGGNAMTTKPWTGGCKAGDGGRGGNGGKGGGGAGGHSLGIASKYKIENVVSATGMTYKTNTAGKGGAGADIAHGGADGKSADSQMLE